MVKGEGKKSENKVQNTEGGEGGIMRIKLILSSIILVEPENGKYNRRSEVKKLRDAMIREKD